MINADKTIKICVICVNLRPIFEGEALSEREQSELYSRMKSFQYAFEGWWYVIHTQHNAWIHAVLTLGVIIVGFWLQLPVQDWAILILSFMAVWMAEFMNTALEAVVDMTMPEVHPLAKVAKDVSAAAVLVGALGSVVIGLLLLGPPLWAKLFG